MKWYKANIINRRGTVRREHIQATTAVEARKFAGFKCSSGETVIGAVLPSDPPKLQTYWVLVRSNNAKQDLGYIQVKATAARDARTKTRARFVQLSGTFRIASVRRTKPVDRVRTGGPLPRKPKTVIRRGKRIASVM